MPTISVNTRFAGDLADVSAVVLSDRLGLFGVRRLSDGATLVPAGTPLARIAVGIFSYSFLVDGPYEYAITIYRTDQAPICLVSRDFYSTTDSSISETDSVEDTHRSIRLSREPLSRVFTSDRGDMFKLVVRTEDPVLMPASFFVHRQRPQDPYTAESLADFMFVATPFDVTAYPEQTPLPERIPAFYRQDFVELLVPSSELAEEVWEDLQQEVRRLVREYDFLDVLEQTGDYVLTGTSAAAEGLEVLS